MKTHAKYNQIEPLIINILILIAFTLVSYGIYKTISLKENNRIEVYMTHESIFKSLA